jgi:group I intron endonuclease
MKKTIYQIRNLVNQKLYIGSTINYIERSKAHKSTLNANTSRCGKLQNAWNKYGKDNFIFEILHIVAEDDIRDLILIEEEYIVLNNSIINGYNIYLPYSEQRFRECRNVKSQITSKEYYNNNPPKTLKKLSAEVWLKRRAENPDFTIRYMNKGKPRGGTKPKEGKEVVGVNNDGTIVHEFRTIFQGVKYYKELNKSAEISKCCKRNSAYIDIFKAQDLYWYFKEEFVLDKFLELKIPKDLRRLNKVKKHSNDIIPYKDRNITRTPICIKNINTNEIVRFRSIKECADFLKVSSNRIHELKQGFKNRGKGVISKIHRIKEYIAC